MASLYVGASRAFKTLSSAVKAAKSGDTIYVDAGIYENDFARLTKDISIVGVGGLAHFKATKPIPNGQAIFQVENNANVVIKGLEFSGATVADNNGAGIRFTSGNLTVRDSYFHHNQEGILTSHDSDASLVIEGSRFVANGRGDGYTHGVYAGKIGKLIIHDSYFEATFKGSHVKSRAAYTEVRDSKLIDGNGKSNYGIDLSNGNTALIDGNLLIQAADTSNRTMISYGAENQYPGTLTVTNNTLVNYRHIGTGVWNHTDNDATVTHNTFVNVTLWTQGKVEAIANVAGSLSKDYTAEPPVSTDEPAAPAGEPAGGTPDKPAGGTSDKPAAGGTVDQPVRGSGDKAADGSTGDKAAAGGTDQPADLKVVSGSAGSDKLQGTAAAEHLDGRAGNDWLWGNGGDDRVDGGAGNDWLTGDAGNDRLTGGAGRDTLLGGNGQDTVVGGDGDDLAYGDAGHDRVTGGAGNDTIGGGLGNDTLRGDGGADRFVFRTGQGSDRIEDFQVGVDKLFLDGGGTYKIVNAGDAALVDFGTTHIEVQLSPGADLGSTDILIG